MAAPLRMVLPFSELPKLAAAFTELNELKLLKLFVVLKLLNELKLLKLLNELKLLKLFIPLNELKLLNPTLTD